MPVVLVVEQDASYAQRIAAALSAMGHDVDLVADAESAARRAAIRMPQLVVVSGSLPDAHTTLGRFSQRQGGPGSLVMAPAARAGQVSAEQYAADMLLYKPFSEDDLRQAVHRLLHSATTAKSPPPDPPATAPPVAAPSTIPPTASPLTSADIFGDVLAEVEMEARQAEARSEPRTPPPPAPPAQPSPPKRPRSRSSDDIDRKLEQTLSGVLPDRLGRSDKARPVKRRVKPAEDDIDTLLDKTLSSLELPRKVRRAKPSSPPAQPSAGAPTAAPREPVSPPIPSPAPTAEPAQPVSQAAAPPAPAPVDPPPLPAMPAELAAGQELVPPVPGADRAAATFEPPSFEPPEVPALELDGPSFELPPTEPAVPPSARQIEPEPEIELAPLPTLEPPRLDPVLFETDPPEQPATAFATPDTVDALPVDDAPTGWSVTSFEDVATPPVEAPSPFATELVPSVPDVGRRASFDEDTFTDVEYPNDFAAAFAPPADGEAAEVDTQDGGEDTGAALDRVLEVRDAVSPQDEGTPFGDYRLLDRVAVGGMAEVWRARRRGVEGFQKTVAIKRILYHLTGNDDFVTMFIDEAKLAAQLHHAHIVQIYDLGKVDDDFFIAMEYVDGKDLRSILNQTNQAGERLPLRLALEIVVAVARALDYAHRKKDDNERSLGLVHRDVSPQNVLIGYESEIKLCDFGIVKAVVKASTTQMGALKGKLQYMSPEQAWGREVDSRSDIFSLGSVLFEVLTGERLFTGDSEIGVLEAVRDGKVRSPRELDSALPESVERVALRALTGDPEHRYQTAGEMANDLTTVLEGLGPATISLGDYLARLFPRTPVSTGYEDAAPAPTAPAPATPPAEPPITDTVSEAHGGRARTLLIAAIVITALAAVGIILYFTLGGDAETPAPPAAVEATPAASPDEGAAATGLVDGPVDAPAAGTPDAGADLVQELVDEAMQNQRDQLEADYEERRQQLERELAAVQGDGGGP